MTAHLRAGVLNRRVSLQQRSALQDTFGGQQLVWTEIKQIYALIEPLGGNERAAAQSIFTDVSHRVTVRYDYLLANPRTVAAYRLVYNNRIFDIKGSLNVEEGNRLIELMANEGMTDG